jgi:hypothetical protein
MASLNFESLSRNELKFMLAAGEEVVDWHRVLTKTGDNVVGELLKNQGTFYEWNHYPKGDIYDSETHGQYFYHAHAKGSRPGEHGHFHTFLRSKGMLPGMTPAPYDGDVEWPSGDDALSHLIGIAMDKKGFPVSLFSVNRWVTGETWYPADNVAKMIGLFEIDHARPSWPVNRWVTAMLRLFRPQIIDLVGQRDVAVEKWRKKYPDRDVYEDRELELTSHLKISVDKQIAALRAALGQP